MTRPYITMSADSTYTNNTTTATNDYFSDWTRSFATAGTGTTYAPLHTGRQESQQIHQKSPEQIKEEAEATERAKTLLLEYLDEDNKQKFLDKKYLEISSKLFNDVKYHIPLSKLGRIKAWKENKVISELCLLVKETEQLPTEDVVLTKLLYVLHDEINMLKTANHFNVQENLLAILN